MTLSNLVVCCDDLYGTNVSVLLERYLKTLRLDQKRYNSRFEDIYTYKGEPVCARVEADVVYRAPCHTSTPWPQEEMERHRQL